MKHVTFALVLLLSLLGQAGGADSPPNVVVIFADDLGYGDLSCYGATKLKTPQIDRLAAEGRRFTDAHSASAVCTPSRYALVTGEYPHRRGLSKPVFLKTGLVIDTEKQTVADLMKSAGYATACIGKWHLGFGKGAPDWNGDLKPGPLELGFDYYYGVPVVNSHPPFVYVENHRVVGLVPDDPFVFGKKAKTRAFFEKMGMDQIGGADAAHALYDDEAVGTTLTEKSVEWIKARGKEPFFLYLSTTNIHHPFTPAPRFRGTSECGVYGDFVHELDWIVGEIMKTLEEQGVADNTLVIFTSDNGGMFNVGGQNAWDAGHRLNGDWLGFKFGAWEGGHRVPFIARWPGKIEAGSISDQLISNIDLIATFAALTGQKLDEGQGRDSVNVLPALTGQPEEPLRDHLVLAPSKPTHLSIRKGKWMYIGAQGSGGFTGAKRGGHAFGGPAAISYAGYENSDIENGKIKPNAPSAQLYDLEADPQQTRNLFRERPEVAKELGALLEQHRAAAPKPAAKRKRSPAVVSKVKRKAAKVHQAASDRPNIVYIIADDLGWADVGFHGGNAPTPNLDRLAGEGLELTHHYVAPVCSPTRVGLLTGRFWSRFGITTPTNSLALPYDTVTLPKALGTQGYETCLIGKWHLGSKPEWGPKHFGFDHSYGSLAGGVTAWSHRYKKGEFSVTWHRRHELLEEEGHVTDLLTAEALRWISGRDKETPFFLYVPFTAVHLPVNEPEVWLEKVPDTITTDIGRHYAACIMHLDDSVGKIRAALEENGFTENTLLVFTSDNGGSTATNNTQPYPPDDSPGGKVTASNHPLRNQKGSVYEGGIRVPTLVSWPGRIPKGKLSTPVCIADWMPTFCDLAGFEDGETLDWDGVSLAGLLQEGQKIPERPIYIAGPRSRSSAVFFEGMKLVVHEGKAPELYSVASDPSEERDLADTEPSLTRELMTLLEAQRKRDNDRIAIP